MVTFFILLLHVVMFFFKIEELKKMRMREAFFKSTAHFNFNGVNVLFFHHVNFVMLNRILYSLSGYNYTLCVCVCVCVCVSGVGAWLGCKIRKLLP